MGKLWLDEQPMWINYNSGLTSYFNVYLPETIEEIVAPERKYLNAYDRHLWLIDVRSYIIALYNILINRAGVCRSVLCSGYGFRALCFGFIIVGIS